MKGAKKYMKILLLVYSKKLFYGQISQFAPNLDLTVVCWKVALSWYQVGICRVSIYFTIII